MVELRQLRYFVAVAEELHFGRAAERVGIAQPPLSQQIQRLEAELGVQLFTRNRRRVALTEPGRAFLDEARATIRQAERAMETVQRAARGEVGQLGIGFVGSATFGVMPPILRRFRQRYPDVELTLYELSTAQQVEALGERRIEIGFVRPPVVATDLAIEIIASEPVVAVLPADHRLADADTLRLSELAGEPFVFFPSSFGPGLHARIVGACQQVGFTPRVVQEAIALPTIVSLVSVGIGVSLLPASIRNLGWDSVRYLPLAGDPPHVELAIAWRDDEASPVVQAFVREVLNGD